MQKNSRIYVAGHQGMVGSALVRQLQAQGFTNVILKSYPDLNLIKQSSVEEFFEKEQPEYVFVAAAKVGGIKANAAYSADFIYQNLMIESNIIHQAYVCKVKKLLFLGSSCIYPKLCPQPIKEEYLLTGLLEPTNEAYAIAKIAGIKLCQMYRKQYNCDFISVMPTNLYGINDNYHSEDSHVIPALIRRFHEAKINNLPEVACWGTGLPRREFLFADDLADACVYLMKTYSDYEHVNIGTGRDTTIKELAGIINDVIGYQGKIVWDKTKPDGTPQKLLDITKLNNLGWKSKMDFKKGLAIVYKDFLENKLVRK